ncbi:hypothetical protein [Desulfovibrio psychrotolerans]|uniref:Rod shape-determining protein MreD n=1 Tax=Desulfovibrio psychrotolerans TaxID=415242 RepID=A0A7J0BV47_9BACT|nr:hypothetical protein [Desulfovibrio psychrotolerans]GFM37062.1 hypothetical protein DSM19430T_17460 [Desulfovibrio psychrotolerans]
MQNGQPSALRSFLWWTAYTVCGVWAMHLLPGVDLLLPGVLCSMQENNRTQTVWLMVLFTFIHEGTGLLAFGPAVLWYVMAFVLFRGGRFLFEAENIVFVFLLSAAMGAWHMGIGFMMHHLQDVLIPPSRLLSSGVLHAVVIPPVWFFVHMLRERELRHVNAS